MFRRVRWFRCVDHWCHPPSAIITRPHKSNIISSWARQNLRLHSATTVLLHLPFLPFSFVLLHSAYVLFVIGTTVLSYKFLVLSQRIFPAMRPPRPALNYEYERALKYLRLHFHHSNELCVIDEDSSCSFDQDVSISGRRKSLSRSVTTKCLLTLDGGTQSEALAATLLH